MNLSIITATYNAVEHLPKLIESLRNQEDKDFEWVVADGVSTDGTLELLNSINDINIKITSQEDFGIYDAINRGVKLSSGEFYLVIGADDFLYSNAIHDYKKSIDKNVDIVTASVCHKKGISNSQKSKKRSWLFAQFAYISAHAVGSIYRKSLHQKFGFYSRKFPIAADQLFVLTAIKGGARLKRIESLVGFFNDVGVSTIDTVGSLTEWYRVQINVGENKFIQTILLFLRLIKNYKSIN